MKKEVSPDPEIVRQLESRWQRSAAVCDHTPENALEAWRTPGMLILNPGDGSARRPIMTLKEDG